MAIRPYANQNTSRFVVGGRPRLPTNTWRTRTFATHVTYVYIVPESRRGGSRTARIRDRICSAKYLAALIIEL
jgi:hypothetical protein